MEERKRKIQTRSSYVLYDKKKKKKKWVERILSCRKERGAGKKEGVVQIP